MLSQQSQQMQEMQSNLEQAQQVIQQLNFELQNHTQADSRAKDAKALKDTAGAIGEVVDAAVTASQQQVEPDAAVDEVQAIHPLMQ